MLSKNVQISIEGNLMNDDYYCNNGLESIGCKMWEFLLRSVTLLQWMSSLTQTTVRWKL